MSESEQVVFGAICLLIWVVIFGAFGAIVGARGNARGTGMLLGILFGPIGILVSFALDKRDRCPKCKSRVEPGAMICSKCHCHLIEQPSEEEYDDTPETVDFACKHCGDVMTRPLEDVGKTVICDCGEMIKVNGKRPTLRDCPDCRHEISRRAVSCPHCGCPTA